LATGTVEDPNRRDFIVIAAQAFVGVGAAVALWPFIQQMNPDASTQALASIEVDLSPVKEGQAITVSWRGKPVFVRHRTAQARRPRRSFRPQRCPTGKRAGDRSQPHQEGQGELDGAGGYLHPPWLYP
jgi:ubiquinol-cytochrome c reductase iron-sulfur subunit